MRTGSAVYGAIIDANLLKKNLAMNCLPGELGAYEYSEYEAFLEKRRVQMAAKIRGYYQTL